MTGYRGIILAALMVALSACSNPFGGVTKLSDVTVAPETATVGIVESDADAAISAAIDSAQQQQESTNDAQPRSGFFARLLGGQQPSTTGDAAVVVESLVESESPPVEDLTETVQPPVQKAGFFSFLRPKGQTVDDAADVVPAAVVTNDGTDAGLEGDEEVAPAATVPAAPAAPETPRPGLFAGLRAGPSIAAPTGPDAERISAGTVLPYGQIATNCEVPVGRLGTKIASESGYAIYDTIPNATAQRTYYITGFSDGCARQFTAALVILGDIGTHEVVCYLPSNKEKYTTTDRAYESIKAGYCGVGQRQPCGARIDRLARMTTFITVYEQFGSSNSWADILLHDGRVIATDF